VSLGDLLDGAALLVSAAGLAAAGVVLLRTGKVGAALPVLLEMLTGAGLLRLAADPALTRALAAAGILVVRRVAVAGLGGAAGRGRGRPPAGPVGSRLAAVRLARLRPGLARALRPAAVGRAGRG